MKNLNLKKKLKWEMFTWKIIELKYVSFEVLKLINLKLKLKK